MKRKKSLPNLMLLILFILSSLSWGEVYLQPLKGIKICIDPGQGGELYLGSDKEKLVTPQLRQKEEAANLRIALFLRSYLEDGGAEVVLTRSTHTPLFPDDKKKAQICNNAGCQFFVGIHHNYSSDISVNYISGVVSPLADTDTIDLASAILREMALETGQRNLGLKPQSLEIFNYLDIPAVLISVGFLTEKKYGSLAERTEYNHNIARAIFRGILSYFEEKKAAPTPTPLPPSAPFVLKPTPLPPLPLKPLSPLMPTPTPISPLLTPEPPALGPFLEKPKEVRRELETFSPLFPSPVDGIIDQSWLFGETWGALPVKRGISFKVPANTTVKAIASGEVIEADPSGATGLLSPYPNYVLLKHEAKINGDDIYSLYAQLASIRVKKGDKIRTGDIVGTTNAPFETSKDRATEFEFEIRIGGPTQDYVQNPELFIAHLPETGCIIGRILDEQGNSIKSLRLQGVEKPSQFTPYQYSMTYGEGANPTAKWMENFAICDVLPGEYVLATSYGTYPVRVEPNKVTLIEWRVK